MRIWVVRKMTYDPIFYEKYLIVLTESSKIYIENYENKILIN